ncbi:hypothetical protein PR048_018077 [Dryococelus australis]|uniref:Uncharacterized protein n=1 Tax=Dryococelus australis TaxID=614101 RepID=A0ABQ9HB97_9NEOP|nr:hypothetical protein PR048_018077 [Dryococelus australis]
MSSSYFDAKLGQQAEAVASHGNALLAHHGEKQTNVETELPFYGASESLTVLPEPHTNITQPRCGVLSRFAHVTPRARGRTASPQLAALSTRRGSPALPTLRPVQRICQVSGDICAVVNNVVLRADGGEMRREWSSTGLQGWGKRGIPEKTRRPAASSGTITTCETPGVFGRGLSPVRLGGRRACILTAQPPQAQHMPVMKGSRYWTFFSGEDIKQLFTAASFYLCAYKRWDKNRMSVLSLCHRVINNTDVKQLAYVAGVRSINDCFASVYLPSLVLVKLPECKVKEMGAPSINPLTSGVVRRDFLTKRLLGNAVTTVYSPFKMSTTSRQWQRRKCLAATSCSSGCRHFLESESLAFQLRYCNAADNEGAVHHKTNRVRFRVELFPDFHVWESCGTILLVGGFSRGSHVLPRRFIPVLLHTRLKHLIGSQDLAAQISSLTPLSSSLFLSPFLSLFLSLSLAFLYLNLFLYKSYKCSELERCKSDIVRAAATLGDVRWSMKRCSESCICVQDAPLWALSPTCRLYEYRDSDWASESSQKDKWPHSGAAPYSTRFTLTGCQDLDVKSHPNISATSWEQSQRMNGHQCKNEQQLIFRASGQTCDTLSSAMEFSMEQHRNERAGETGNPRENPPTRGIVWHDSHLRTWFTAVGGEQANRSATAAPGVHGICEWSSAGMQGAGKTGDPQENTPTSGIVRSIPPCENPEEGSVLRRRTDFRSLSLRGFTALPRPSCLLSYVSPLRVCNLGTTFHPSVTLKVCRGAAVAERLACSPPAKANRVQSPAGSLPDFRFVGIVPDDAASRRVFSEISRFPHAIILALFHTHLKHPHRLSRPR